MSNWVEILASRSTMSINVRTSTNIPLIRRLRLPALST
jgi:hypothetical protein